MGEVAWRLKQSLLWPLESEPGGSVVVIKASVWAMEETH